MISLDWLQNKAFASKVSASWYKVRKRRQKGALKTTEGTKKKAIVSLAATTAEEISVDAAVANVQCGLDGIFTIKA